MSLLSYSSVAFALSIEDWRGVKLSDGRDIYGKVIKASVYEVIIDKSDGKRVSVKFDDVSYFLKDEDIVESGGYTKESPRVLSETKLPINKIPSQQDTAISSSDTEPAIEKITVQKESPESVSSSRHTWEIGPELSYYEYKEPGLMSLRGPMFGIGAAYTYHNGVMIKLAGSCSYGLVDYDSDGTGSVNNIEDSIFEFRVLGGYDFKISKSFTLTPFIGFGYRYLKDNGGGETTTTGNWGYDRESKYYYSPIGIQAVNVFDKGWSIGVNMEYDLFWKGTQKSFLSDGDAGYSDPQNDQDSGYGLRGSIMIKKQTDQAFYVIEPFVRYWNIDESDVQAERYNGVLTGYGWIEPKNETTEIGVKFVIGY